MADAVVFYNGPIVSRADAIRDGLKFYFTGKPCNKGHIAQRYTSSGCVVCSEAQRTSWSAANRDYHKKLQADWYKANKDHHAEYGKQWRKENPERVRYLSIKWKTKHRERYLFQRKVNRQKLSNKEVARAYDRRRYHTKRKFDAAYSLHKRIQGDIWRYLKQRGIKKGHRPWEQLVGYTQAELVARLKKTMPKGYVWQDYLDGRLHLDHIIPRVAFNVTSVDDIDFRRCWALTNLQLLPASVNCAKGARLAKPFQPALSGI